MLPRNFLSLSLTSLALSCLAKPVSLCAALYADVATDQGTFTIDLDYVNAPITVGNFIGLATGELAWIDPDDGQVRENTPYFEGIVFHRVIAGFVNQTGDPTGTGRGGPGYRFTDELATSTFDEPYRVAMANSGPQTNGSQFFVTAPESSLPDHLDGLHTVFGHIPQDDGDGGIVDGSRAVVDAINAVPTDNNDRPETPVTILSVTVRRTDPAAEAFEIPKADLPTVAPIAVEFEPQGDGGGMALAFTQPPGTTFRTGISGDLAGWEFGSRYISSDASAADAFVPPVAGSDASAQFYTPVLVSPVGPVTFPNTLANRTLTTDLPGHGTMRITFTDGANAGTFIYQPENGSTPISGTIVDAFFEADATGCRLALLLDGITPEVWDFNRMGLDGWDATEIDGRHGLVAYEFLADFPNGDIFLYAPNTFSLTRP
jgi:peptidyl-prolyl cis-trans isomerase A (cyclophilin A)